MRTLWIGLLTLLAHGLQTWSEAVTRRLERTRRSAAERATPDHAADEVDGPPADWSARVKSAQPPTHWRAKVQQGASDSIERAAPSTPADRPYGPQRSEDTVATPATRLSAQPPLSARPSSQFDSTDYDAVRVEATSNLTSAPSRSSAHDRVAPPVKPATRSWIAAVRPTSANSSSIDEAASAARSVPDPADGQRIAKSTASAKTVNQRMSNVPSLEADRLTPDVESTAPVDEVSAARSQTAAPLSEHRALRPTQLTHAARAPSTLTDLEVDDQTSTGQAAHAERDVPAPDRSQHAQRAARSESPPMSMTQPTASVDATSPIEPRADHSAASWPVGNTLRSTQTWAAIAGQRLVEYESNAIEHQWPALPPERVTLDEDFETIWRERERLRRLDLEQRGLAWSA